jgi:phage tail-like protein
LKRTDIEQLLPGNYRRAITPDGPLSALLDVMEANHEPDEVILAGLDRYFDSRRTHDRFVDYLARWVDLGPLLDHLAEELGDQEFPSGTGRLRELVALAAWLSRWRGTARCLIAYLEVATGVRGFTIEENAGGRPFHLRFVAPPGAAEYRPLIEGIIDQEKPAYTTHEIVYPDSESGGQ